MKALALAFGLSAFAAAPPLQAQSKRDAETQPAGATGGPQTPVALQAPPGITPGETADPNSLANEAANPAAPLTQIQIRDILVPSIPGTDGATNLLQIQPVIPIGPFRRFPWVQLVKINVQLPTLPEPAGRSGFGDLDVFDLVTIKAPWGRWGLGPSLVFPTASSRELGAGKWQAGPAMAVIYTGVKNLTAGAVFQNPISFGGDSGRAKVNELIIAPTLTYSLSKGWFAGLADYNWTFDWENGGEATVPLGVQVGKILRIAHQPFNVSMEIGRVAARPADTPNPGWMFGFEFSPIFNWHLGPGQKIHLRGKKKN